jgi:hypothetical protein
LDDVEESFKANNVGTLPTIYAFLRPIEKGTAKKVWLPSQAV